MKTFSILISGAPSGDNLRDVSIEPGTTSGELLRSLGLDGYLLTPLTTHQAFGDDETIYHLPDGTKLRAVSQAEVGTLAFFESILRRLGIVPAKSNPPRPAVPPRVVHVRPLVLPSRQGTVLRDRRPHWETRGWRKTGDRLDGYYRTSFGSYRGEVLLKPLGKPEFYVLRPPKSLLSGRHGPCFRDRGGGRFFVHFSVAHRDPDAGIMAVERLLAQSLHNSGSKK